MYQLREPLLLLADDEGQSLPLAAASGHVPRLFPFDTAFPVTDSDKYHHSFMEQQMLIAHILDLLPLWGVFFVTFLLVFISEESGFRFGRRRIRSEEETKDPSMGSMVGATLGLLAFMLAFTFGMASARYDTRRQLIRDEANAIHTAYLRADFVSEPRRTEIQRLLREYVDVRLAGIRQPDPRPAIARSEEIHHQLWIRTAAEGERN